MQRHLLHIYAETNDQIGQDLPCKAPPDPSNHPAHGAEGWMQPVGQREVIVPLCTALVQPTPRVLCPVLGTSISEGHQTLIVCPEERGQDGKRSRGQDL